MSGFEWRLILLLNWRGHRVELISFFGAGRMNTMYVHREVQRTKTCQFMPALIVQLNDQVFKRANILQFE